MQLSHGPKLSSSDTNSVLEWSSHSYITSRYVQRHLCSVLLHLQSLSSSYYLCLTNPPESLPVHHTHYQTLSLSLGYPPVTQSCLSLLMQGFLSVFLPILQMHWCMLTTSKRVNGSQVHSQEVFRLIVTVTFVL